MSDAASVSAAAEDVREMAFRNAPSRFIVGPFYDRFFFIFSPLLALALGAAASLTPLAREDFVFHGRRESWISLFSGAFTMAHLVIVFFRSHGNPGIFKRHPVRFVAAPLFLFGAMALSSWMLVFVFVLAVWWDVYHSALQTFGLGRLYDVKAGCASDKTRSLDRGLNLVLYIGPVIGGAVLMDHLRHLENFATVGTAFFAAVPARVAPHHGVLTRAALFLGGGFVIYYAWKYFGLVRRGYAVSREKVCLFAATAVCSIWAWGFNSFGQAFFIMNFFHALQYFALVWHAEKKRLRSWPVFIAAGFTYGVWAKLWGESSHAAFSLLLTVSIMHFWYDGFIWSVRRGEVA